MRSYATEYGPVVLKRIRLSVVETVKEKKEVSQIVVDCGVFTFPRLQGYTKSGRQ